MLTDKQDFDEIYNSYKNLVMKAAYKYSEDYDIAEDIAQSTFLQLYKYIDKLENTNIKSWLYTTAKNMALNENKKAEREVLQEMTDEWTVTGTDDSAEEKYMNRSLDMDRSRLHEVIFTALYEKNERWYMAIRLVYYLEIPQVVVAEEMGIRVEVLHSLLHRAKEWIKKNFEVEYDELNQL